MPPGEILDYTFSQIILRINSYERIELRKQLSMVNSINIAFAGEEANSDLEYLKKLTF